MIQNGQGAIAVIGDVMLSAWRRPYQLDSLDDIARTVAAHDPQNTGRLTSVALYRFDRIRFADFADASVRQRMVDLSQSCRYRQAINVLDAPGVVSGTIRLAFSSLMLALQMPYPVKTVDSIDAALVLVGESATADRNMLSTGMQTLIRAVWREQSPV